MLSYRFHTGTIASARSPSPKTPFYRIGIGIIGLLRNRPVLDTVWIQAAREPVEGPFGPREGNSPARPHRPRGDVPRPFTAMSVRCSPQWRRCRHELADCGGQFRRRRRSAPRRDRPPRSSRVSAGLPIHPTPGRGPGIAGREGRADGAGEAGRWLAVLTGLLMAGRLPANHIRLQRGPEHLHRCGRARCVVPGQPGPHHGRAPSCSTGSMNGAATSIRPAPAQLLRSPAD